MDVDALLKKYSPDPNGHQTPYLSYETYFRGTERTLERRKEELRGLVREVQNQSSNGIGKWLDLACGNGLLLEVLDEEDIEAFGVEIDSGLASTCTGLGLSVFCGDVSIILDELIQHSLHFDVVSSLHLIEHMEGERAERLVRQMSGVLDAGGLAVIATPNAEDTRVMLGSFYRDPTHVRPYPLDLIEYYCTKSELHTILSNKYDRFISDCSGEKINLKVAGDKLLQSYKVIDKVGVRPS